MKILDSQTKNLSAWEIRFMEIKLVILIYCLENCIHLHISIWHFGKLWGFFLHYFGFKFKILLIPHFPSHSQRKSWALRHLLHAHHEQYLWHTLLGRIHKIVTQIICLYSVVHMKQLSWEKLQPPSFLNYAPVSSLLWKNRPSGPVVFELYQVKP